MKRIGCVLMLGIGCILSCQGPVGSREETEPSGGSADHSPDEDPDAGQDVSGEGFGDFFSGNVHPDDCGRRSVRDIPANVVLEETQLEVHTVDPPESVLGRVVGAIRFNETCDPLIGDESTVYVVGVNGEIEPDERPPFLDLLPQPQLRFVAREGCLETESDEPDVENPFNNGGIQIIPPTNVCEDGSFPIGSLGLGDVFTEFICAKLHLTPCVDCGMDGAGWFRRATATLRVEAEENLDEVLLRNECGDIVGSGSIQAGDVAIVTIVIETRHIVVELR